MLPRKLIQFPQLSGGFGNVGDSDDCVCLHGLDKCLVRRSPRHQSQAATALDRAHICRLRRSVQPRMTTDTGTRVTTTLSLGLRSGTESVGRLQVQRPMRKKGIAMNRVNCGHLLLSLRSSRMIRLAIESAIRFPRLIAPVTERCRQNSHHICGLFGHRVSLSRRFRRPLFRPGIR